MEHKIYFEILLKKRVLSHFALDMTENCCKEEPQRIFSTCVILFGMPEDIIRTYCLPNNIIFVCLAAPAPNYIRLCLFATPR